MEEGQEDRERGTEGGSGRYEIEEEKQKRMDWQRGERR